jgi:hypothetical protein
VFHEILTIIIEGQIAFLLWLIKKAKLKDLQVEATNKGVVS